MDLRSMPWWDETWRYLDSLIQKQKLPHALILEADKWFGTDEFMLSLNQRLICHQPVDGHACGACEYCQQIRHLSFPDTYHIRVEEGKRQISVDQIRAVSNKLNQKSYSGGFRVVIFYHAELMNIAAANALLKTLEEPGDDTFILLQSASPSQLPATIRSRCQKLKQPSFNTELLTQWLLQQWQQFSGKASEKTNLDKTTIAIEAAKIASNHRPLLALDYLKTDKIEQRQNFHTALANLSDKQQSIANILKFNEKQDWDTLLDWTGQYLIKSSKLSVSEQAEPCFKHQETDQKSAFVDLLDCFSRIQKEFIATNRPDKSLLFREFLINWIAILPKLSHS